MKNSTRRNEAKSASKREKIEKAKKKKKQHRNQLLSNQIANFTFWLLEQINTSDILPRKIVEKQQKHIHVCTNSKFKDSAIC